MRARRLWPLAALALLSGGAVAADVATLARQATMAQRQATVLERRANRAAAPAERARLREEAVAARVTAAEADIAALRARAAIVARRLAVQRDRLARQEEPVARLLAALTSLARRPAVIALAQPGTTTDLVHVQAVLHATLPALRARSAALRADVARIRVVQADAAAAERQLRTGRARLVEAREQLAAVTDTDDDRALTMEEVVRDNAAQLATIGSEQTVLADLLALPVAGLAPAASSHAAARYRLPVEGRVLTGTGELSGNGVRARGLTLAAPAAATVVAPAAGRVSYAGPFRSFGRIVIIDHGAGWTTLVTGLGAVEIARGADVSAGTPIGRAPAVEGARITVELRRRGRPMDVAQLAG
ncbi:MAG: metalloendopeptidase [Sphingomonas taxi]|uniref:Metalloendopeptidase n=1 Tax=Sphingomonas taxi TaxID=1549858 RepID=A0A2W5P7V7_9SPHN|nr:MAG: metalloendopeptidase [Sphingomonas taxi]